MRTITGSHEIAIFSINFQALDNFILIVGLPFVKANVMVNTRMCLSATV